ncbi:MAG: ABC-2 family transporter protein [Lachnospiraceae bacterium]|nr:ABC-2 family transporter protein [Lachnospiraceae bacterium]
MDTMKKYFYVIKTQIIKSLTYEFNVYGNIIMQTIIMITSAYFWRALYKDRGMVGDVDVDSMLTYVILSSLLSVLFITNVERRIEMSVEKGTVATDMMKPINVFGVYFAEDIGNIIALALQNMLPILLIGSLMIRVPVMKDIHDLPFFIISVVQSFLINWLVAALFGMIAFSAVNIDALIQVKKHLLRLLSGSIIPIWFFPGSISKILGALPFVYIYQLPVSIYIGKVDRAQQLGQLGIQFIWLVILSVIFLHAQNRVTSKVMIQGG